MRNYTGEQVIMNAKAANGAGNAFYVKDFRHVVVTISGASADLVIKAAGAISDVEPDWTDTPSADNPYSFVQMRDYEDNSAVNGDDGITFGGSNDVSMLEINTNGLVWLNFIVSGYNAGSVTAKGVGFNDS